MKRLLLFFAVLSAVNLLVFFFRDEFQFVKYSTYADLYAPCDEGCRDKWSQFMQPYSGVAVAEARGLLQPLRLDTGSTLSKIRAIGHHLYAKFYKQAGFPQEIIHKSDPLDDYKILSADSAQKVWCGTYAVMFSFFCWSHNIVCRNVEIYRPGDHHVLNECFVPELNQWVMVDVTANMLNTEMNGKLLNIQDFMRGLSTPDSLKVLAAGTTSWQPFSSFAGKEKIKLYYRADYPVYYYHTTAPKIIYSFAAKAKRYFLPLYWYEIFSVQKKANLLFWTKLFCLALWLILVFLLAIKKFKK